MTADSCCMALCGLSFWASLFVGYPCLQGQDTQSDAGSVPDLEVQALSLLAAATERDVVPSSAKA